MPACHRRGKKDGEAGSTNSINEENNNGISVILTIIIILIKFKKSRSKAIMSRLRLNIEANVASCQTCSRNRQGYFEAKLYCFCSSTGGKLGSVSVKINCARLGVNVAEGAKP